MIRDTCKHLFVLWPRIISTITLICIIIIWLISLGKELLLDVRVGSVIFLRNNIFVAFWSPELAAELLENFLQKIEAKVQSYENSFFYCPNYVQLENLNIKERFVNIFSDFVLKFHFSFFAVTPYLLVSSGVVYFIVAVSGLSHPCLLSAIFAISNFFVFGSFTTGWSSIIINYALSVSRSSTRNSLLIATFFRPKLMPRRS